jgi:hypothetical protein
MLLHNLITYKVAQLLNRVLAELPPYIYTIGERAEKAIE